MDVPIRILVIFLVSFVLTAIIAMSRRALGKFGSARARKFYEDGQSAFRLFAVNGISLFAALSIYHSLAITSFFISGIYLFSFLPIHVVFVILVVLTLFALFLFPLLFERNDDVALTRAILAWFSPFYILMRPFAFMLEKAGAPLFENKSDDEAQKNERIEEKIELMIDEGAKQGSLKDLKGRILRSAFDFGDTLVREVMVPRTDLVCCPSQATLREAVDLCAKEGYSRLPVYGENTDDILGIVYFKDLMLYYFENGDVDSEFSVTSLMRKAFFVPETNHLNELFEIFQREHIHMSIVVDEFGGTAGIVTLEDLMEVFFGDIQDEYDSEIDDIINSESNADISIVDAKTNIDDFNDAFGSSLRCDASIDSIGGMIVAKLGYIPVVGEIVLVDDLEFRVEEANERCVLKVVVRKILPAAVPH